MAMIWSFEKGEWQSKCLDSSSPLKPDTFESIEIFDPKNKLKVTMVIFFLITFCLFLLYVIKELNLILRKMCPLTSMQI